MSQAERAAESTQRLLEAAVELIADKGFERTSAAEIGERAGYSREMVRSRYGTKQALLEHLLHTGFEPMFLTLPKSNSTGLATLLGHFDHLAAQAEDNPELLRAFFILCFETVGPVRELAPWLRDWIAGYRGALVQAIQQGLADGSIKPDLDVDAEAGRLLSTGAGIAFRWTLDSNNLDFISEVRLYRDWMHSYYSASSRRRARK